MDSPTAPLVTITPARVLSFADCPRRYRLTYLDRPRPPRDRAWAHTSVGTAVHLALRRWWDLPAHRRLPAQAARLVGQAWSPVGFRDQAHSQDWRDRAAGWTADYAERWLTGARWPGPDPIGVERTVAVAAGGLAISGRVDRLDLRDGEVVVVDYKTGRRPCTEEEARGSLQLALYALAAAATLRRPCAQVELHHLPTGTVQRWRHPPEALARQRDRAAALARDARRAESSGQFPAVTGPLCGWCDVRRHCPEGQAAAPAVSPWAGLGEPAPDQSAGQTQPVPGGHHPGSLPPAWGQGEQAGAQSPGGQGPGQVGAGQPGHPVEPAGPPW